MDLEKFQEIQDLFSDSTGLAAIAVGVDGKYITEPSNFNDFCMKIKSFIKFRRIFKKSYCPRNSITAPSGMAPTLLAASFPFLNKINVGIAESVL